MTFEQIRRQPLKIFLFVLFLIALVLVPKVIRLWPLYLFSALRQDVQHELTALADERGWILSDLSIKHVTHDSVRFIHRNHGRVVRDSACYDIALADSSLTPCEK